MWEKTAIFVAFVALLSGLVNGKKCRDDEEAEQNFVLEKFIGKWYILGKDQLISPLPETIDAIIMKLKSSPDNSATFECSFMANGNPKRTIVGTFSVPKPKEGKLVFSYKKDTTDVKQPVTVLSTDYDQFAIIWLCVEHSDETIEEFAYISTRANVLLDVHLKDIQYTLRNWNRLRSHKT